MSTILSLVAPPGPLARRGLLLARVLLPSACDSAETGGPVAGAADTHCGATVVTVDSAACTADPGEEPDPGDGDTSDYGPTRFGTESDDDDCKYHVKYSVTAVRQSENVTFTVVATHKSDGSPVTGAATNAEVFLNDTHPAPNSGSTTKESPPGTYTIGPVRFDASGQWTARFHFFEDCSDSEASPHGHTAFLLQVP